MKHALTKSIESFLVNSRALDVTALSAEASPWLDPVSLPCFCAILGALGHTLFFPGRAVLHSSHPQSTTVLDVSHAVPESWIHLHPLKMLERIFGTMIC